MLTDRRAAQHFALIRLLEQTEGILAIPIVAAQEQCKGWLAKIHRAPVIHRQIVPYARLAELVDFLAEWKIIALGQEAADIFDQLRRQKIRIGSQDLKIAAIALAEDALLLSANLRDS